jgi:4,5-dihydroxyphthalate decarboxylase
VTSSTVEARPRITLAARAWGHLMPLARGSVGSERVDLRVELRDKTPDPLAEPPMTVAETSFSSYVRGLAAGDDRLVGLPVFVMRAFRHRCLLVPRASDLTRLEDLRGRTIGATGWPDSGNTWTRSLLRRAGVGLDEVKWLLAPQDGGRLEPSRIGRLPDNVSIAADGVSLLEALGSGSLDAAMTPFVPADVHRPTSGVRHLLADYAAAEADYLADVGFVPGIHLMTLRRADVERHPWLAEEVVTLLQASKQVWRADRWRYADDTPWTLRELQCSDIATGADWMPYGLSENAGMIAAFCTELHEQGLTTDPVDAASVFAVYQRLTDHPVERI